MIGEAGPTVFDFQDERQRSLLIGLLMVGGGLACLLAIFVGHDAYGRLLGKLAGALLVYGGMRIVRAVKGEPAPRTVGAAPGAKAETVPLARILLAQTSLPPSAWNRVCLVLGRAGGVVMALCFLSLAVSVVLFQVQRTVVVIGVPDLASGYVMLAVLVFSLLFGISWASLTGAKGWRMVGRTLGLWLIALSLALVPVVITSGQLAQAAIFSGHTSLSIRTYRVQSASESSGRGGTTFRAQINPYHCVECVPPAVVVDKAAYDAIRAGATDAPVDRNYPWDDRRKTTNLCMMFTVERVGAAERIRLIRPAPFAGTDLRACPAGTP